MVRSRVPYSEVAVMHDGMEICLPIREVRVRSSAGPLVHEKHGRLWSVHQVVWGPGLPPQVIRQAAQSLGLSAALSWLAGLVLPA